jgi:type I restriction enzyme S subunit
MIQASREILAAEQTKWKAIGDVTAPRTETRDPRVTPDETFEYVDISGIDRKEKIVANIKKLKGVDAPSRARKVIRAGDVLVSTVRPNLNAVALIQDELENQVCSTGFCVLRANPNVLPDYLFYFVRSSQFIRIVSGEVAGAMYPATSDQKVKEVRLPVPSLHEQHRIVDILKRADGIRRLRNQAQDTARQLIPALFIEMFGDPATNPKGWPMGTIGDVITQAQYGTSKKAHENGAGLPVIRMGNVLTSGALDLERLKYVELNEKDQAKYKLETGDILFNRTNSKDLVGKTGVWNGSFEAVAASYFIVARADRSKILPTCLWVYMNTPYMKRRLFDTARGAIGQSNINAKELKAFSIPLPPIELQEKLDIRLESIHSIIGQQEAAQSSTDSAFQSLLQCAFSELPLS